MRYSTSDIYVARVWIIAPRSLPLRKRTKHAASDYSGANSLQVPCRQTSTSSPAAPTESACPFPQNYAFGRFVRRTSGHEQGAGGRICGPIHIRPPTHRICTRAIIGASSWSFPLWRTKPTSSPNSGWHPQGTGSSQRTQPFGPTQQPSAEATRIPSARISPRGVRLRLTASGGRPSPRSWFPRQASLAASAALPRETPTPAFLSWPPPPM